MRFPFFLSLVALSFRMLLRWVLGTSSKRSALLLRRMPVQQQHRGGFSEALHAHGSVVLRLCWRDGAASTPRPSRAPARPALPSASVLVLLQRPPRRRHQPSVHLLVVPWLRGWMRWPGSLLARAVQ